MTTLLDLLSPFKSQLQKTADNCFRQGYGSTRFARTIAHDAICYGVNIPSADDYYHLMHGENPAMNSVLNWLGYAVSSYGFGICKMRPDNFVPTFSNTNESTWQ